MISPALLVQNATALSPVDVDGKGSVHCLAPHGDFVRQQNVDTVAAVHGVALVAGRAGRQPTSSLTELAATPQIPRLVLGDDGQSTT